jgi:acyl carrier protein phosphodiesterase
MNYLAHAYLSFGEPQILTGNMISDFVRGKKKFEYSTAIQNGITLHRFIDEFTDTHDATRQAKAFFRPHYRLYAGAFVDIVYDHFLATDHLVFTATTLKSFSIHAFDQLIMYQAFFPEKFKHLFYYMRTENWLYNYRFQQGIYKSFGGLVRRASYMDEHQTAYSVFENNYDALQDCYQYFFPSVKQFAFEKFQQFLKQ